MSGTAAQKLQRLEKWLDDQESEAKSLPLGHTGMHGTLGSSVSSYAAIMWLVRKVRAVLEVKP